MNDTSHHDQHIRTENKRTESLERTSIVNSHAKPNYNDPIPEDRPTLVETPHPGLT